MILKPEISVILSTYNRHRPEGDCPSLFERALNSVLNQTFFDFELILIDDASTDGTAELCKEYAQNDCRIKLIIHEKNTQLPAKCYNEGMSKCSGKFIAFMFDDDVMLPNALKDLHSFFSEKLKTNPNIGMVYGLAEYFDVRENIRVHSHFGDEWDLKKLFRHNYLANCCVMVRRDVIDRVGGYDEHPILRRICDWDLWKRIGRRYSVLRLNKVTAQVYQNQSDSVGVLFDWIPNKAKYYSLLRTKYPIKVKPYGIRQHLKYLTSFFIIYNPTYDIYHFVAPSKNTIKKTLVLVGCWKPLKKIYDRIKA